MKDLVGSAIFIIIACFVSAIVLACALTNDNSVATGNIFLIAFLLLPLIVALMMFYLELDKRNCNDKEERNGDLHGGNRDNYTWYTYRNGHSNQNNDNHKA